MRASLLIRLTAVQSIELVLVGEPRCRTLRQAISSPEPARIYGQRDRNATSLVLTKRNAASGNEIVRQVARQR